MRKILLFLSLNILTCLIHAESAKQPPLMVYEHCDKKGLVCSGESELEEEIDSSGFPYVAVGAQMESNEDLLLNLDHYYSNKCKKEMGLNEYESLPKLLSVKWRDCVVTNMTNAVKEKNQQNIEYVEKLKKLLSE